MACPQPMIFVFAAVTVRQMARPQIRNFLFKCCSVRQMAYAH